MSEDVRWVTASAVDDLWEGDLLDVEVDGEQVMLVHLDGGGQGLSGHVPAPGDAAGRREWDADRSVLLCHGHSWEFDLTTGNGVNPAGCRLFEFPVRVEGDDILVGIPQDGRTPPQPIRDLSVPRPRSGRRSTMTPT